MTGSEIATFREGATIIASAIQAIVKVYRQNRTIALADLQLLRIDADKTATLALIQARGEIARANVDEIAKTARLINSLSEDDIAVQYAISQLEHLSWSLGRLLDDF